VEMGNNFEKDLSLKKKKKKKKKIVVMKRKKQQLDQIKN